MASSLNGTGVTFSNGSQQAVAWPGNTGTVTSIATGNGLSGGTITTTGTLAIAAPTPNTVGSYVFAYGAGPSSGASTITFGSNYAAGSGTFQMQVGGANQNACGGFYGSASAGLLSGTWKWLGPTGTYNSSLGAVVGLAVRVA